jgi:hypothetical protein
MGNCLLVSNENEIEMAKTLHGCRESDFKERSEQLTN